MRLIMIKSVYISALITLASMNATEEATLPTRCLQSAEAVRAAQFGQVDARGLKILIDSQAPMVILDARGRNWNDPNIIPGAQFASSTFTDEEIFKLVPQKDLLIVVYCYSSSCPLGKKLILKLIELGYSNILDYPGGLKEWRDVAHYPVETAKR